MADCELGWFADVAGDDPGADRRYPWQPVLQASGMCLTLDIWFASRDECEQWITDNVVGKQLLDD